MLIALLAQIHLRQEQIAKQQWPQKYTCKVESQHAEGNGLVFSKIHFSCACGKQDQQRVKDKKEGQCQQRSGCHLSVTKTAARAQRAAEHKDGHWTGFGHIPQALHHIPKMVGLAHLSCCPAQPP